MPDSHSGYGMPIGGVAGLDGVVSPYMVGKDIGCGMCFVPLGVYDIPKNVLKQIKADILKVIPVGAGKQSKNKIKYNKDDMPALDKQYYHVVIREFENATRSLGTLGGGNHFIEFQKDVHTGEFGIMLHSGSRNLGNKVCNVYNKSAVEMNEKYHSKVPKYHQLAFLPLDTIEGMSYFDEMTYCVEYALKNRKVMMDTILGITSDYINISEMGEMINIAHNYAVKENHYGKNVVVHRKGATLARKGTMGIIPGSMGSPSYIVEGLGNKESFMSCSHGAGRPMSRGDAKRKLDLNEERKKLDKQGIIHDLKQSDLDEAEGAYKNINVVMENQSDLVKIHHKMRPIIPVSKA